MGIPDYALEQTLDFPFSTRSKAGASIAPVGLTVVVQVNDGAPADITAGIALSTGSGQNNVRIAATAANGFAEGNTYSVRITAGTVDGESVVGQFIDSATFSLGRNSAVMPLVPGRKMFVANITGGVHTDLCLPDSIPESSIENGAFTEQKFAAGSLNGKGDWNVGKTGYDLNADQSAVTIGTVTNVTNSVSVAGYDAGQSPTDAIETAHLDHLLQVATTTFPGNVGSILGEMLERITTWRYNVEALSQGPSGGAGSGTPRAQPTIPNRMEIPPSGTTIYRVWVYVYDVAGGSSNADSTPTVTFTNASGTNRDANKNGAVVNSATGVYYQDYDVASTHPEEDLQTEWTVVESGTSMKVSGVSTVEPDATGAQDWTATERSDIRQALGVTGTKTATANGDVQNIQTRLPASLVSGTMDCNLSLWRNVQPFSLSANRVLAESLISQGAIDSIADEVWDSLQANHTLPGSFGQALDAQVSTRMPTSHIAATGGVVDTVDQVQNVQVLGPGSIAALSFQVNSIVAGAIAAGAFNGKGDWNIGKTGYDLNADQSAVTVGTVNTVTNNVTVGGYAGGQSPTDAIETAHLDHLLQVATTTFPGNAGSILGEMLERITTWRYTVEAVSQAPSGGAGSGTPRAQATIPTRMEIPPSATLTYRVWLYVYDVSGGSSNADSLPTVTFMNASGTSRDANKNGVVVNSSTGVYYQDYDVASTHPEEELHTEWTAVESGTQMKVAGISSVEPDVTGGQDWTATERSDIRQALGVTGTKTAATGGDVQSILTNTDVQISTRMPTSHIAATAGAVDTVTTLTNLPAIPANWLTEAGIANGALSNPKFGANAIDINVIAPGSIGTATFVAGAITPAVAPNLDASVASRMPTTHIAATAGVVDTVNLVNTTTTNTDMRGTDGAATSADVLAQVNAALDTAIPEMAQGAQPVTPSLREAAMLPYMRLRNQHDVMTSLTPDVLRIYNDSGIVIAKKTVTDDDVDYAEAKMVSGP